MDSPVQAGLQKTAIQPKISQRSWDAPSRYIGQVGGRSGARSEAERSCSHRRDGWLQRMSPEAGFAFGLCESRSPSQSDLDASRLSQRTLLVLQTDTQTGRVLGQPVQCDGYFLGLTKIQAIRQPSPRSAGGELKMSSTRDSAHPSSLASITFSAQNPTPNRPITNNIPKAIALPDCFQTLKRRWIALSARLFPGAWHRWAAIVSPCSCCLLTSRSVEVYSRISP